MRGFRRNLYQRHPPGPFEERWIGVDGLAGIVEFAGITSNGIYDRYLAHSGQIPVESNSQRKFWGN